MRLTATTDARAGASSATKSTTPPEERVRIKQLLAKQQDALEKSFSEQDATRAKLNTTVNRINSDRLAAWQDERRILRRTGETDLPARPEPLTIESLDTLALTESSARKQGSLGGTVLGELSLPSRSSSNSSLDSHARVSTPIRSMDELLTRGNITLTSQQRSQLDASYKPYQQATATVVKRSSELQRTARSHPDMVEEIGREHMQRAQDFFTAHGFDASDGNGTPTVESWDDPSERNAHYSPSLDTFLFGRIGNTPLATSGDVVIHEYAHRIFDRAVSNMNSAEARALSESFSDVVAVTLDTGDWRVGEDAVTNGIRHLDRLGTTTISNVGSSEPHELAAVSNAAAYRIAQATSRETMGEVYVKAVDDYLTGTPTFRDMARATWRAAVDLYGAGSAQVAAVKDAWNAVLEISPGSEIFTAPSAPHGPGGRTVN